MKLSRLIQDIEGIKKIEGRTSIEVRGLACNSKMVKEGELFIAVRGTRFNGMDFIEEALDRGAQAVILEGYGEAPSYLRKGPTYIYVEDARTALSNACNTFFKNPTEKMYLIGVTGTNGKTTVTYLLEGLFKKRFDEVGIIGTINYRFGNRIIPSLNTTPGSLELCLLLNQMQRQGIRNCVLEVSSHSLEQRRVDVLGFDVAIFTNLTREHLDYHKTMEGYMRAKTKLFLKIKRGGYAVINRDDVFSERILEVLDSDTNVITYGIEGDADIVARAIECSLEGSIFKVVIPSRNESLLFKTTLIGLHNVYNILAAVACGFAMGMNIEEISCGIETVTEIPGRLEKIDCGQGFLVFVDYAHTEHGLENALMTLKSLKQGQGRLLCVFGCGGDRDTQKRPRMGKVASELSDKVFITSDNPRTEEPADIINQIVRGMDNKKDYVVEADRLQAIEMALHEAKRHDIVLIAGKGHETCQIFKDTTIPFDDREIVRRILINSVSQSQRYRK